MPFEHPVLPGREGGQWKYLNMTGRRLDRKRFEEWKTKFYRLEGWNPDTGWPTRQTLESVSLSRVADSLEGRGRLGS